MTQRKKSGEIDNAQQSPKRDATMKRSAREENLRQSLSELLYRIPRHCGRRKGMRTWFCNFLVEAKEKDWEMHEKAISSIFIPSSFQPPEKKSHFRNILWRVTRLHVIKFSPKSMARLGGGKESKTEPASSWIFHRLLLGFFSIINSCSTSCLHDVLVSIVDRSMCCSINSWSSTPFAPLVAC